MTNYSRCTLQALKEEVLEALKYTEEACYSHKPNPQQYTRQQKAELTLILDYLMALEHRFEEGELDETVQGLMVDLS